MNRTDSLVREAVADAASVGRKTLPDAGCVGHFSCSRNCGGCRVTAPQATAGNAATAESTKAATRRWPVITLGIY